jgi:hypothetical protein
VRQVLGLPSTRVINAIVTELSGGSQQRLLEMIAELKEQGIDPSAVGAGLSKNLRDNLKSGICENWYLALLKNLIDVPASANPYEYLEICLLEACQPATTRDAATKQKTNELKPKSSKSAGIKNNSTEAPVARSQSGFSLAVWQDVIENARQKNASIYTALRLAEPSYNDGILTLSFQFPLHQKKIDQSSNKALVAELIESLAGTRVPIECVVDKSVFRQNPEVSPEPVKTVRSLESINSVFGPSEVLETS